MIVRALLSRLYHQGVCFRHYLYDKEFLEMKSPPLPVVSIGNLVAGGAGKTQATLLLAKQLQDEMKIAILTRGYRGRAENGKESLCVDVASHSPELCGDEPWLLASRLRASLVLVNKNRFKSALKAKKLGADLCLLDDGMQHRQLGRNFEIVVIDGNTPLKTYLPQGRLREDPSRLKQADLILFIGSPLEEVKQEVCNHSEAPQVVAQIVPEGIFTLGGIELEPIAGKSVGVFCGIGDPHRFIKTVEERGARVVAAHFAKDHTLLEERSLMKLALLSKERGATHLLCTEKDKVKLLPMQNREFPLPIAWVKAHLQIVEKEDTWNEALRKIRGLVRLGRLSEGGKS